MGEVQLLLFEETKEEELERKVDDLKRQTDKMRRALFARHGELMKLYMEQRHELETLKAAICKNSSLLL